MMNTMTGGCNLPRQILRWFDSLDLSFSVRNPKIDLANGFLVGEILSRYYPKEVNVYTFYNNQAKDKRLNNWEQIQKVLQKKEFRIEKDEYEAISNLAPEAALNLVYRLYEFLTHKKIHNDNRTIVVPDETPFYMKPTASYLAKDRQLSRLVDTNQKEQRTKSIIGGHLTSIKNKKYTTGLIEWLIAKRKAEISEEVRRQEELLAKKTRTIGMEPRGEVKEIQLKCFDSSASKVMGNGFKAKGVVDFLLDSFGGYLKKDFVMRDIRRLGLQTEMKEKEKEKEKEDGKINVLNEIFKRSDEFEDDRRKVAPSTLEFLLKQLSQPAEINLVFENIKNNFVDFQKFFLMFLPALKSYKPEEEVYKMVIGLVFRVSSKLVESDHETTSMMFQQLVLSKYMQVPKEDSSKTQSICEVILSFTQASTLSQLQMSVRVHDNLPQEYMYIRYLSYFVSIILVTLGEIDESLWAQGYEMAMAGLKSASPTTRTHCAKIISELIIFSDSAFKEEMQAMSELASDDWWEVRALSLIIFSRLIISKCKSKDSPVKGQEQFLKQLTERILSVFHKEADERILRIGLVELAELLNYKKELCDRYLEVLLSVEQGVLADVINVTDHKIGTVSDTNNIFEYRLTGAAAEWDPTGVALSLQASIRNGNMYELQKKYLDILSCCIERNSEVEDKGVWLDIYQKLQSSLLRSLKGEANCELAGEIVKKFFVIPEISQQIMQSSKVGIKQLLSDLYESDNQKPQANILSLLSHFSGLNGELMEYVYQTLKEFSEDQKDKYLGSTLVEFMNQLARKRREKMFKP